MKLIVLLWIVLTTNVKQLVLIELEFSANLRPKDVYCEDVCTDGRNCLTDEWFVCKWKQIFNRDIVCCFGRRTDNQIQDSVKSVSRSLQTTCALRKRPQHVAKRGFFSFLQSLTTGLQAREEHFPWMVSVLMFGQHICGGSLISDRIVVTAAHCFAPLFDSSVYSLRIGSNRLSNGKEISVGRVIRHELYFPSESYHDISLVITKTAIDLSDSIDIICLPSDAIRDEALVGRKATAIGFKSNRYNSFLSQPLKPIKVKIISTTDCALRYASGGDRHNIPIGIHDCMICATTEGTDTRQGDSGGPLSVTIGGVHYLIGIVSFGRQSNSEAFPGVYTNVLYYRKWISAQMARYDNYYSV